MTDEQPTQIQITCQSCGAMFDTEIWPSDDETVLFGCPSCDALLNIDGSAWEELQP